MNTPPPGNSSGPNRLKWLDAQLANLAGACPHTKTNPNSCPLHEVRKLSPAAIGKWLDALRLEEKEYLMLYHQCCLVIRWESQQPKVGRVKPKSPRRRRAR
ncbi:MAG: hypothetical protein Q7S40_19655 [Opitutaceae bacterium]|nr:hypothetical protein [Opitutaceae bacterium]